MIKDFADENHRLQTDSVAMTSRKDKCSKIESKISPGMSAHFDEGAGVESHLLLFTQSINYKLE